MQSSARDLSPAPKPIGHSRQASVRRQALLRRSTIGPLDNDDDPLAGDTADLTHEAARDIALPPSNPNTPGPRADQERNSPSPAPEPTVTIIDREAKSFSFLIRPENFIEIPQQDVPAPFREELPEQISRKGLLEALHDGHYRSAAFIVGELLKACNDTDHETIFRLLYVRLACLQIVGLHAHAAQESKSMQDVTLPFFRDRGRHLMPWELRVLVVRLQAMGFKDWRRGIMSYHELAREARFEARRAPVSEKQMWTIRLRDLGLRVANALIETKDLQGAIQHLKTLSTDGEDVGVMKTRMALLYLRCGDVDAAKRCFDLTDEHSRFLHPLCTMAEGDFTTAASFWMAVKSNIDDATDEAATVDQAIAICKLYDGQVHEAREILESLVQPHGALRGLTFNLSTIYELSSEDSTDLKTRLAEHIVTQPAAGHIWDKSNSDFKL